MKVGISRESEIKSISAFFNECGWLKENLKQHDFENVDFSEYEIFKDFDNQDVERFLSQLVAHADGMYWEKALMNLRVLIDNCADKELDHLDFNATIKAGLVGLDLLKEINECLSDGSEITFYKAKISALLAKVPSDHEFSKD